MAAINQYMTSPGHKYDSPASSNPTASNASSTVHYPRSSAVHVSMRAPDVSTNGHYVSTAAFQMATAECTANNHYASTAPFQITHPQTTSGGGYPSTPSFQNDSTPTTSNTSWVNGSTSMTPSEAVSPNGYTSTAPFQIAMPVGAPSHPHLTSQRQRPMSSHYPNSNPSPSFSHPYTSNSPSAYTDSPPNHSYVAPSSVRAIQSNMQIGDQHASSYDASSRRSSGPLAPFSSSGPYDGSSQTPYESFTQQDRQLVQEMRSQQQPQTFERDRNHGNPFIDSYR